jgi:hypothetical protein
MTSGYIGDRGMKRRSLPDYLIFITDYIQTAPLHSPITYKTLVILRLYPRIWIPAKFLALHATPLQIKKILP